MLYVYTVTFKEEVDADRARIALLYLLETIKDSYKEMAMIDTSCEGCELIFTPDAKVKFVPIETKKHIPEGKMKSIIRTVNMLSDRDFSWSIEKVALSFLKGE